MIKIVQQDNKVLRKKSTLVEVSDIKSERIQKILTDMKKALDSQKDGVALAAPQIGVSMRIFIVSHKAFELQENSKKRTAGNDNTNKDIVFINPEIIKLSKKKQWLEEGCLSVRWLYGSVNRSTNATIVAYNENGEKFTRGAGGLLAQMFQHEVDHLNGILFIDKAREIEEIAPNKS